MLIGVGTEGEDAGSLSHKFIQAVRNLRTEVGIPDSMDVIKEEDFPDICQLAIAEGATYPVPRLLDQKSVRLILGQIAG